MSKVRSILQSAGKLANFAAKSPVSQSSRFVPALVNCQSRPQLTCAVLNRNYATQGDGDIVKFLVEEIATEKKSQKPLPALDGWDVKTEGAEVTLTRAGPGGEKVIVSLNVNHTVDSAEPDDGQGEAPEMLSRPNFEVDIVKSNGKTLSFTCSYIHPDEQQAGEEEQGMDDLFAIDEVTMFEGENVSDKNYAVAGDILDGYLYDLFMNMLEERGVDNKFVDQLSSWCSAHEHTQYITLLQELEKFAKL